MLYPTELRTETGQKDNGRGERIRTFDPLVPNQMRYQAALRPDWAIFYRAKGGLSPTVLAKASNSSRRGNRARQWQGSTRKLYSSHASKPFCPSHLGCR